MGFLKTTSYREFHVSASSWTFTVPSPILARIQFVPLPSFIHTFNLSAFLSVSLHFFLSYLMSLIICFRSIFLSHVHTQLYPLIDPNRNLRPILCLFPEVPTVPLRTVPRLTPIRLSGQSIPPIKLVEQADQRRSKFRQFAYIFRRSTKAKLLSWLSGCSWICRKRTREHSFSHEETPSSLLGVLFKRCVRTSVLQ